VEGEEKALRRRVLVAAAARKESYIFHPYPVTPYHSDYLQHFDLAESVKNKYRPGSDRGPVST
jgi:hypothetical protein